MNIKKFFIWFLFTLVISFKINSQIWQAQDSIEIYSFYNKSLSDKLLYKWPDNKITATITNINGKSINGQIMHFTDSVIWFYVSDSNFLNIINVKRIVTIPVNDVSRIQIYRKSMIRKGAKTGFFLSFIPTAYGTLLFVVEGEAGWAIIAAPAFFAASVITIVPFTATMAHLTYLNADYRFSEQKDTYNKFVDEFKKFTMFPDYFPGFISKGVYTDYTSEIYSPYKKSLLEPLNYSRIHIDIGTGIVFSRSINYFKDGLAENLNGFTYDHSSVYPKFDFNIAATVFPWLKLNMGIDNYTVSLEYRQQSVNPLFFDYLDFDYSFFSANIGGEFVYKPTRRIRARKSEISAGTMLNFCTLSGFLNFYNSDTEYDPDTEILLQDVYSEGISVYAKYALYPVRFISIYGKTGLLYSKNFKTPVVDISDYNLNQTTIGPFTVGNNSFFLQAGICFHLF